MSLVSATVSMESLLQSDLHNELCGSTYRFDVEGHSTTNKVVGVLINFFNHLIKSAVEVFGFDFLDLF